MKTKMATVPMEASIERGFEVSMAHVTALKDFINMTIHDPSFFAKSRAEQNGIAFNTIQAHKGNN